MCEKRDISFSPQQTNPCEGRHIACVLAQRCGRRKHCYLTLVGPR